ncbi:hypothetical protein [Paenibacillus mucilaginosus]|uniref:hypothetical protein n=1 Tax=Paenibacillus mucilaginosus TaxID=61624 RepID=UPI003D24C1CE
MCKDIFKQNYRGCSVRNVHVSMTNLQDDTTVQMDLFEDNSKEREIGYVMDSIRNRFGSRAIFRARSLTPEATSLKRSGLIGGHKA